MDEAARKAPVRILIEFRLGLLKAEGKNAGSAPNSVGGASRQAHVLKRVREISGPGQSVPDNVGMGVATKLRPGAGHADLVGLVSPG